MTNTYTGAGIFSRLGKVMTRSPLISAFSAFSACLMIMLVLSFSHAVVAKTLPSIANAQSSLISPVEEKRIGKLVAGNLNRLPASHKLAVRLWLSDLVRPLLNQSNLKDKQLQLFLLNNRSINAFATPGGIVGVHTGLILETKQVDELVAVLAHEIAHISQRHYAHRRASEERMAPVYFGAFLASILVASKVDANIGEAGIHATQAALIREQMSYSRANEQDADRVGLQLMHASQFDTSKMLSMLELLGSPLNEQDPNWAWARSHPISEHRIADMAARVEQLPNSTSSVHYQTDFQLLRIMLATQLTDTTKKSLDNVSKQLDPLDDNYHLYQQFAEAMVLLQQRQWAPAAALLETLSAQQPTQSFIWDRWLYALLAQGDYQQVIAQSRTAEQLGLHIALTHYFRAQAYNALSDMAQANKHLNKLLQAQPLWIGGWQLLAEWSGQTANLSTHRVAMAQWHLLRGEFDQAREQTLLGEGLATSSDSQRQQLLRIREAAKVLKATAEGL